MTTSCRHCRLMRAKASAPFALKERISSHFRSRLMRTRVDNVDSCSSSRTILVLQGLAEIHFSCRAPPKRSSQRDKKSVSYCELKHFESVDVVTGGCDDNVDNVNRAALGRSGRREAIILPGEPNTVSCRARCAHAEVRPPWRSTHG